MRPFLLFFTAAMMLCSAVSAANAQFGAGPAPGAGFVGATGANIRPGFLGNSLYAQLAVNESLIKELKITHEQKKQLQTVAESGSEMMRQVHVSFEQEFVRSPEEFESKDGQEQFQAKSRKLAEVRKALDEKLRITMEEVVKLYEEVLTEKQAERVRQIERQSLGVRAFSNKHVQEELKLSDDQKNRIQAITEQYEKEWAELESQRQVAGGGEALRIRGKIKSLRTAVESKIIETLSAEQKMTWKSLIGAKFDVGKL